MSPRRGDQGPHPILQKLEEELQGKRAPKRVRQLGPDDYRPRVDAALEAAGLTQITARQAGDGLYRGYLARANPAQALLEYHERVGAQPTHWYWGGSYYLLGPIPLVTLSAQPVRTEGGRTGRSR